jgi:hypothetical protein
MDREWIDVSGFNPRGERELLEGGLWFWSDWTWIETAGKAVS